MLLLSFGSVFAFPLGSWFPGDDSDSEFVPTIVVPEEQLPVYPDPDEDDDYEADITLHELLNLNQASLNGYAELLNVTTNANLRIFIEIILQQRRIQSKELAALLVRFDPESAKIDRADAALVDPNSAELRILWLRAIWCYEQERFGSFSEKLELAESRLEEAYLTAAEAVQHADIAALFLRYGMDVCGARQRIEELTYDMR